MTRSLVYLDTAMDDLADIATYIAHQSGIRETGEHFILQLQERCERLAELPGIMGSARSALGYDFRSTPFQAYVIYFRYRDEGVEIVNVLHASRDADAHFHG